MTDEPDDLPDDPTEADENDVPEVDENDIPIEPDEPSDTLAHPTETNDPAYALPPAQAEEA